MLEPLSTPTLPRGIRARFVDNINGLRMHVLEAGFEEKGRPCLLLLHGFPELAYSWRKVMLPLAAAGYHVVAPDLRGYGRTTGWDGDYDGDLGSFRMLNIVRDIVGLVSALGYRSVAGVVGHDYGSPVSGLVRAGAAGRVPLGDADERAVSRAARDPVRHRGCAARRAEVRPDHPRRSRRADAAAQALPLVLFDAPRQRRHDGLPAGHPRLPARLLPPQERGLESEQAAQAGGAGSPASSPRCRPTTSWSWTRRCRRAVAPHMPSAAEIAACKWLPDAELAVYAAEYGRTGFQGGLQNYRVRTSGRFEAELEVFAGRTIDQPSCFISGKSDWGVYQAPGVFERMQAKVCTRMLACHLVDGAGHWVQQEQPEAVDAAAAGVSA